MRPARRLLAVATLVTGLSAPAVAAAPLALAADDYPYRADISWSADPYGFTKRQCVSFAAVRLAQHRHAINNAQHWGSAYHWGDAARAQGITVSTRPVVGAIAQWNADERSSYFANGSRTVNGWVQAGGFGHVAYVSAVYGDGSVAVEQYNMNGARSYSTMHVKAPRYLYVGVR